MAHILFGPARRHNGPGTALIPQVHILLRIERHHSSPCGTAGGVNADTFGQRYAQQSIRILIPQIILVDKGQSVQILYAMDILGLYPRLVHSVPVKRHILIYMLHLRHQSLALQSLQLRKRHGLNLRLVIISHLHSSPVFIFSY